MTFVVLLLACVEARGGSIPFMGLWPTSNEAHRLKATQPSGRQPLLAQASLFAPHRSMTDMLVALASPAPKMTCRERHRIYASDHLVFLELL